MIKLNGVKMGEKIEIVTDRIEDVGYEGELVVWEISMNKFKSQILKRWAKSERGRVLGVPITRKKMPKIRIIFEKLEEGEE